MLHIIFKRGQFGQENWRRIKGIAHLTGASSGTKFQDEERQIQPEITAA